LWQVGEFDRHHFFPFRFAGPVPNISCSRSMSLRDGIILPVQHCDRYVGETPSGRERFQNLRAELWWRAREWLEQRDSMLTSEELIAELTTVTYAISSNGKIQIESKDRMLARGVASPDMADSFVLTFSGADRRKEHDRYERQIDRYSKRAGGSAWAV
jgi:hypothetical protein